MPRIKTTLANRFNASIGVCDVRARRRWCPFMPTPPVSMPQSACVMFEPVGIRGLARRTAVSMPQSACVMFERHHIWGVERRMECSFNASIGVCDVRADAARTKSIFFDCVSMPQSACVMFELAQPRRQLCTWHVSMPQSACVMFERIYRGADM